MYIEAWKEALVIRGLDRALPEELAPRIKYNEKVRGYITTLSFQNLMFLSSYFKTDLKPFFKKGYHLVEEIKAGYRGYLDSLKQTEQVKNSIDLPPIEYKIPPLAEYQHKGVWFLLKNPIAPLFASPGLGKTFMVLVACEKLIETREVRPGKILVCGKLATLETGWMEDAEKFTNLKASLVYSSSSYKRKEKLLAALDEPADIYITNHDTVRTIKDALVEKRFEMVIVDESTILKSFRGDGLDGGAFGKALCEVSQGSKRRIIMSGTPAPNGPEDLWGQFKFLDPYGFIFERKYSDFKREYMIEKEYGIKNSFKTCFFNPERIVDIKSQVARLAYRVKLRDHLLDLPERTTIKRLVRMSKEQQAHYDAMEESLATTIEDQFISVDEKLSRLTKLRQITGGFLIDQEENPHVIETATKMKALDELMEEVGMGIKSPTKIVIFAQYQWEISEIENRYKYLGSVSVYGGNQSKKNLDNIKEFIHNPETKVIVLHPRSAAHGITLTVSHYMIFYSISYSAEDNCQCVARIERASQKHPMFIYYLLAGSAESKAKKSMTIDEVIYAVIARKEASQEELLEQRIIDAAIINSFKKL